MSASRHTQTASHICVHAPESIHLKHQGFEHSPAVSLLLKLLQATTRHTASAETLCCGACGRADAKTGKGRKHIPQLDIGCGSKQTRQKAESLV
jgi:hypothetical protein